MRPDNPHDTLLTDSLRNTESVIVGSQKIVDFFHKHRVPCAEYLPVTIIDHKGRAIDAKYYIVHPTEPIDCLDKVKSVVTYSPILKTCIDRVQHLVLDESKIPSDRNFFRCLSFYNVTIVRRSLVESIGSTQFSGFRWMELNEYS